MTQLTIAMIGAALAILIGAPIIACIFSSIISKRDDGRKP